MMNSDETLGQVTFFSHDNWSRDNHCIFFSLQWRCVLGSIKSCAEQPYRLNFQEQSFPLSSPLQPSSSKTVGHLKQHKNGRVGTCHLVTRRPHRVTAAMKNAFSWNCRWILGRKNTVTHTVLQSKDRSYQHLQKGAGSLDFCLSHPVSLVVS